MVAFGRLKKLRATGCQSVATYSRALTKEFLPESF